MTELASNMDLLISSSYDMFIADCKVMVCNCPSIFAFDIGVKLAENRPFSMTWYFDGKKKDFIFSLYSSEAGKDVGQIAKTFGGSGSKNFANFSLKLEEVDRLFDLTGAIF